MLQAEVFSIDRLPTYPWIPRIAVVCVTMMHLQVKAGTAPLQAPAPDRQQQGRPSQASPQTAPVINPVGASSNYTNKGLVSVKTPSSASCGQSVAVAAPSNSRAGSHAHVVTGERVDQAQHGEAMTAADTPPAETNTSQLDNRGRSGSQENALPGYQVCCIMFLTPHTAIPGISCKSETKHKLKRFQL